jgi:hypothetical protein
VVGSHVTSLAFVSFHCIKTYKMMHWCSQHCLLSNILSRYNQNGTHFIKYKEDVLNALIWTNHFFQIRHIKQWMDLGVFQDIRSIENWSHSLKDDARGHITWMLAFGESFALEMFFYRVR